MLPSVRGLLRQPELLVTLVNSGASIDEPINWVHGSDLADPTPFLERGQMLLTTGTQFPLSAGQQFYDDYVNTLSERGIVAIGFGTEVVRSGCPSELVLACAKAEIPLVEVPYSTPFIAIIRWVADELAREARARDDWALAAQHAIAIAAVGAGGLGAALTVLGSRLGSRVAFFDQDGALDDVIAPDLTPGELAVLSAEVHELLRRGRRAANRVTVGADTALLQTLGSGSWLSGVLAVIGEEPDAAAISVITSVVALAEMSLKHDKSRKLSALPLHREVIELLLGGFSEMVLRVVTTLPPEPISVVVCETMEPPTHIEDELATLSAQRNIRSFIGPYGETLVIIVEAAHQPDIEEFLSAAQYRAGVAGPSTYRDLGTVLARARHALGETPGTDRSVRVFSDLSTTAFLDVVAGDKTRELAAIRLGPILTDPDGASVIRQCLVWLNHNGRWDVAARALGVHRHTLKARVHHLFEKVGLDAERFADRAQLWAMLTALDIAG